MSSIIVMRTPGGPEVLQLEHREIPTPGPGQVRIAVRSISVNYPDLLVRAGRIPLPLPATPGFEVAGVVAAVGEGVANVEPGARVATMLMAAGGYAEHVIAPSDGLVAIPAGIPEDTAVALQIRGLTALLLLREGARLRPGESVYIPAAAGGVGSFLVQLARHLGAATVIAAASSASKRDVARELGADVVVDPATADLARELGRATGGRGVDVVLAADAQTFAPGIAALASLGRLVLYGAESAFTPPAIAPEHVAKLIKIGGSIAGFGVLQLPADLRRAALAELFDLVGRDRLRVLVRDRFALADAAAAHRALEARTVVGNVILRV